MLSRFTVILPDGQVIGDTEADPASMDNHADRMEIVSALKGEIGQSIRYSHTIDIDMLYVAIPLYDNDNLIAVIRTSIALTSLDEALRDANQKLLIAALLISFLIMIASYIIAQRISKPLEILKNCADRFGRGDLEHKVRIKASAELNSLAEAMNKMANELKEQIADVENQRNEKEAVLASMVEGIIAVDLDEKIISINQAASELLGIDYYKAPGQTIQEAIRNARLQMLITKTMDSNEPAVDEIVVYNGQEYYLQVHATQLVDNNKNKIGVLIVLENITRIKKLENIRREFIANVSHELKTPITSIRGYIETLIDGLDMDNDEIKKFLEIANKHTSRLNAIVDDLLQLSRIEQNSERGAITLSKAKIKDVIYNAIIFCQPKAQKKDITIKSECLADIETNINPQLLEQAIINLIENAVNYSEPGKPIEIKVENPQDEVIIEVKDQGCGIDEEHLTRIFERFYRVEKSRSRETGGTGLGLSIVKHIAQAHNGYSSVESTLGEGSVFRIHVPN